jgi:hypothetical protein
MGEKVSFLGMEPEAESSSLAEECLSHNELVMAIRLPV